MKSMRESKYRKDIQVLRGLAVVAVVLFHSTESRFTRGYLGVDIFFVVSGFVITPLILEILTKKQSMNRSVHSLIYFYRRRFYRLAPALAFTLVIAAIVVFLLGPIGDHRRFARQGIATILLAGNVGAYKYSGDYFSPNPNPLIHTWSLSLEEQIYLVLPIVLMLTGRAFSKMNKNFPLIFVLITLISFILFIIPNILQSLFRDNVIVLPSQFLFFSPIHRIWQFTLGSLAYFLVKRYKGYKKNFSFVINIVFIIALVLILFGPGDLNLKIASIIASFIAATVIVMKSLDSLPHFLSSKLEWLGDRSYSIYLFHMPFLYIAKFSPVTQIGNSENRTISIILAAIVSVIMGSYSYSTIEKKFRIRDKNHSTYQKISLISLIITVLLPLSLFIAMETGLNHNYWGLNKNITRPSYAGDLDLSCARDSTNGPPCIYMNVDAKKTVLLIGDSHAGQISQAVVDAASVVNWNAVVWTHAGCHVQFQRTSGAVSENCINMNKQMKKWVLQNRPDVVIVSQVVHSDSNQSDLRNALLILRSIVPNILLIENGIVFPDKEFMVARPLIMTPYKPPKSFLKSKMQNIDKNASDSLANWANNNEISTVSFESIFCTNQVCNRYLNSNWLFRDGSHLSTAGAALTIPELLAFLRKF